MNPIRRFALATAMLAALAAPALAADAPLAVEGAWARASVQGQKSTGAFMTLKAARNLRLVAAASPAAGVAEVHEMKMDGEVMRMRPVEGIDLPAGRAVELKPGGYHVMLMDLKMPLATGTAVPIVLTLRDAAGVQTQYTVQVPVALQAPGAAAGAPTHKH